jgi:hypothetical protein
VVAVLFEQVVPKRSAHESVGVLANRDGQVREYSRTPPLPLPPFATPFKRWRDRSGSQHDQPLAADTRRTV